MADKPKKERRYYIKLQWRKPVFPNASDRWDWAARRVFAVIPILFKTREAAEWYMRMTDIFMNLRHHRKLSASIETTEIIL